MRRNPRLMAAAALPLLLVLGAALWKPFFSILLPHSLLLGAALLYLLWIKNPRPLLVEGEVEAGAEGVRFAGALLAPRGEIKRGFVIPRGRRPPLLRLERQGARLPIEIRVPSEGEGRRLLRGLGLDASQSVAAFSLPSQLAARQSLRGGLVLAAGAAFFLLQAALGPSPVIGPAVAVLILILSALVIAFRTELRVGADGIVTRWLGRERFIPYEAVRGVAVYEDPGYGKGKWTRLRVALEGGEEVVLPVAAKGDPGRERAQLIAHRIEQALADHRRGDPGADAAKLARGDRAVPDWVRALRSLGAGAAADHRVAPVPPDRLLRIAEDPRAEPAARAGAAVALSAALDDDARARLAAAAAATAQPRVRVVLQAAARGAGEEALAEALAELEAEREAPRRPSTAAAPPG